MIQSVDRSIRILKALGGLNHRWLLMIQSVDRSIRILKALGGGPGRLGVSELSDRLGLAKGTVHGLLRTLQAHGLVAQHPDSDKYQLGPQLLQLSNRDRKSVV